MSDEDIQVLRARVAELEAEVAERSVGSRRALMGLGAAVAVGDAGGSTPRAGQGRHFRRHLRRDRGDEQDAEGISELLFRVFTSAIGIQFPKSFMELLNCLPSGEHFGI